MTFAIITSVLIAGYAAIGVLVAVYAHIRGLGAIDPDARHATTGFRLLVTPGLVVIWPAVLKRFRSGRARPPVESTPHKRMWPHEPHPRGAS